MFRHKGTERTLKHNLRIASLLSFVAGIVNITGFLSVQRLTTNVTGHFAILIDEIFKLNFLQGFVYFLYIFFFFLGSFVSSFLVELMHKKNSTNEYVLPVLLESVLLAFAAIAGKLLVKDYPDLLAFILLFSMGLQNSLVTTISNAVVRTTHLTGLFTDLGIEISQLFFYKDKEHTTKLQSSIKLRLTIISFFFIGGIIGGMFYSYFQLYTLLLSPIVLLTGLLLDYKNKS